VRFARPAVVDAFCNTRLARDHGFTFGTLPAGVDASSILVRAVPE